jgi:ketol-acid reductoisomerase
MTQVSFGGVVEEIVTRKEFTLDRALGALADETIAVLGYGVQGPGQGLNLRDNGARVIVGQRTGTASWDRALADGWIPGETLFSIDEAARRGTMVLYLVSDAAQKALWPTVRAALEPGNALVFSHGFSLVYSDQTGVIPPDDVDVVMVAPKGSGADVRGNYLAGSGINSSYAIAQDATGRAAERVLALGIAIGS